MNRIKEISKFGQQIWLDYISRDLVTTGRLAQSIEEDGLAGITSNPAIFRQSILTESTYQQLLSALPDDVVAAEERFEALAIPDIQLACDAFASLYQRSQGDAGYVSFEVSPACSRDARATVAEAKRLWAKIARSNVMIKIPATSAGLEAMSECIEAGINVNVTLIFSLLQAKSVAEAYCKGLRRRVAAGNPVEQIRSVASVFISRIDSKVDPLLAAAPDLLGQAAIAQARVAYEDWQTRFSAEGAFNDLAKAGARPQLLLWASTGVKNPAYSDVMYIEQLIGPDTVNTVPADTLKAFRDHGTAAARLGLGIEHSKAVLVRLHELGIDMEQLGEALQQDGLVQFERAFAELLDAIALVPASH